MTLRSLLSRGEIWLLVALAIIIVSRILSIWDGRDPGIDQAALMSSLPLESLGAFFRPLPFFEQSSSLGSLIELDIISRIFGVEGLGRFHAARSVAALAAIGAYLLFIPILRKTFKPVEIALILILMASPKEILLFTTNPKHYVLELLMAVLLLLAARAYLDEPTPRRIAMFLIGVMATCVFAISAPLIVVVIGGGMIAATLAGEKTGGGSGPALLRLLGLGAVSIAICVLFYLGFTKPVTSFQFGAYQHDYTESLIDLGNPFSPESLIAITHFLRVFAEMITPSYFYAVLSKLGLISLLPMVYAVAMLVTLIGFPEYWRRSKLLAGGLVTGLATFLVLNFLGSLPFASMRHFMFFAPFLVPSFTLGLLAVLRGIFGLIGRRRVADGIAVALVLIIGLGSILRATDLENTEVTAHFDRIEAYPAPLWAYYGAQPSMRALRPDLLNRVEPPVLGLLSHQSSNRSWAAPARADLVTGLPSQWYLDTFANDVAGTGAVWLLFANHWPERSSADGLNPYFERAEASGRICHKVIDEISVLALCTLPDEFPPELSSMFGL